MNRSFGRGRDHMGLAVRRHRPSPVPRRLSGGTGDDGRPIHLT